MVRPAAKNEGLGPQDELLKAKNDALRLLSFRPRSVAEMRQRLKMKRYAPALVEEVVASLEKQGFLNDEQFAKLFAGSSLYTKPTGKRKLETELKKKGVPAAIVRRTLDGLEDYDEKKAARDLVYGRFQKMTGLSREKKKTRIFGFLKRRGFETGVIFQVMEELFKESLGEATLGEEESD